jgi:hypothetical protein
MTDSSVDVVHVDGYQWQCSECWMCGPLEDDPAIARARGILLADSTDRDTCSNPACPLPKAHSGPCAPKGWRNTDRETLAKLIYKRIAFQGGDPEHYEAVSGGIYHDAADAILAEFLPAHDERVRVEYEERRKPDPIHIDNIDSVNAATWFAAHDERVRAEQRETDARIAVNMADNEADGYYRQACHEVAAAIREGGTRDEQ